MARAASKPKPRKLHLVVENEGKPGSSPEVRAVELPQFDPNYDNGLRPPVKLSANQRKLWDAYIIRAPWLTHFDIPRAHMWVVAHAQWMRDPEMVSAARVTQLRYMGSELGLDPASRTKLGAKEDGRKKKSSRFFND